MVERTFSISTGLAASTVTPGRHAFQVPLQMPEMPAVVCALAGVASHKHITAANPKADRPRVRITAAPLCLLDNNFVVVDRTEPYMWPVIMSSGFRHHGRIYGPSPFMT